MELLTPTVHERISHCAQAAFVDGVVATATVSLTITRPDGTTEIREQTSLTGGGVLFEGLSFVAGSLLVARQRLERSPSGRHTTIDYGFAWAEG